jgi:HK97 family phage portal protein
MGFLAAVFDNVLERRNLAGVPLGSPESSGIFGVRATRSGIEVTGEAALTFAAFWDAVSQISGTSASLPLQLFRRLRPRGSERVPGDPRYDIVHAEPNPETTAVSARQTIMKDALVYGNGFAELTRNNRTGKVKALWQLPAAEVRVERDTRTERLMYRLPGTNVRAPAREMVHVAGMSYDGVVGYSVVGAARESIGRGLASDAFAASFYGNGAWPGITIVHPGDLGPEGRKDLTLAIQEAHGGSEKAFRALVLDQAMTVSALGMPLKDAEFLAGQRFSVEEMARWFNLKPHRLKVQDSARVSNHEADNIEFYSECLRLWLVRFEQELNRKLLTREERQLLYFEHNAAGLLRGDAKTRHETYSRGRQWGYMSANDVLELEGRNPLPGGQGDLYLVPENMTSAESMYHRLTQERERVAAGEPLDPPPPPNPAGVSGDPDSRPGPAVDPVRARRIRAAHRRVALEAAERAVRHTTNAVRRAAGRGVAGFRAWIADGGLQREQDLVARMLLPAITACLSLDVDDEPGRAAARALEVADAYGTRIRAELAAPDNAVAAGEDLAVRVEIVVSRWEKEWPSLVLEQVQGGPHEEA